MKFLQKAARHIVHYRYAYLIALFLIIAGLTCGVMTGNELEEELLESISVRLSVWKVLWLVLKESAGVLALLLISLHPFGCALAAALLLGKSFAVGYCWGWWMAQLGWSGFASFLLTILPQGLLSLGTYAWGCSMTSYAALHIDRLTRKELLHLLLTAWILQAIAVLLRCIGCAWGA